MSNQQYGNQYPNQPLLANPYSNAPQNPYNQAAGSFHPFQPNAYAPNNQGFAPNNQGFAPNNQGFVPNNQGFVPNTGNTRLPCPFCMRQTDQISKKQAGGVTYIWCFAVFLFTGICCCIPFCIDSCQDTVIACTLCKGIKGRIQANCC